MGVGVFRNCFSAARSGDPFPGRFALEIKRQLVEQVLGFSISRQVHTVAKHFGETIVGQVVGDEQGTARHRLEDAHVDVVADAAIEHDAGC